MAPPWDLLVRGGMLIDPAQSIAARQDVAFRNGKVHVLMPHDVEVDLSTEGWDEKRAEMAAIFLDFLRRVSVAPRP